MSYTYEEVRRQLLDMIAAIHRDHQRQIQPYVEQLARLEASRPPSPMLIRCQELLPAILAQATQDTGSDDEWRCSQYPGCECFAGCREKALEAAP